MAQIVTPVPPDPQELANKRWYFAQKIRQCMTTVIQLRDDPVITDQTRDYELAHDYLDIAWHDLRKAFNELVPDEHKIGVPRAQRKR